MTVLRKQSETRLFHPNAYQFVFAALRCAQENLGKDRDNQDAGHISGRQLLEGVRLLALEHFGLMTVSVFADWGIHSTEDFGRIVFELIESGEMRKTDDDDLSDFVDVYDFRKAFLDEYELDTSAAFTREKK